MAAAQTSPWPWVLGGAAVAGGVFAWHRLRGAPAPGVAAVVDASPPLVPPAVANATGATTVVAAAPVAASVVAPVAASVVAPVAASVAPVAESPVVTAPTVPSVIAPTVPSVAAPSSFVAALPFVPPVVAAAVAASTAPSVAAVPALDSPIKVYPLLRWRGYAPHVSDGWGSSRDNGARVHHGADIMYPRRTRADQLAAFPAAPPHSPGHFMPDGSLVVAVADGEVWSVKRTSRGLAVVLQHAGGWVTFYQHLARVFLPFTDHANGKIAVRAGQAIGIVGVDPSQGARAIAHLHFELRRGVQPVDPARWLKVARILDEPTLLPAIEDVLAQPRPVRDPREAAMLAEIYQRHGAGIPVAYLAALGRAESGGNARHPKGVLNLTRVAIDEYNRHHSGHQSVSVGELSDPVKAVRVAAWVLREVIASYQANHADVPALREDWTNPDFVALLTAGWNAGHSEKAGVGRVASYLTTHRLPVTLDNVWRYARSAGAAATLRDPNKRRFAERVTADYLRSIAGGPS